MLKATAKSPASERLRVPAAPIGRTQQEFRGRPGILGIVVCSPQQEPRSERWAWSWDTMAARPASGLAGNSREESSARRCLRFARAALHSHTVTHTGRTHLSTCTIRHVALPVSSLHLFQSNCPNEHLRVRLAAPTLLFSDTSPLEQMPWQ